MNILIVRLGALGDIVHTIPAAAALRTAFPAARIDWVVDAKHRALVDLVTVIDRVITVDRPSLAGWLAASAAMRQARYDVALDFQGLMKSAVLARMSGAPRVVGFSIWHLREKTARPFYTTTGGDADDDRRPSRLDPGAALDETHVIAKNIRLLEAVGIHDAPPPRFPLAAPPSAALEAVTASMGADAGFALLNPGAAWPNKRWPADRFGEVAAFLREVRGLTSLVLWGPGEQALAEDVAARSNGAATLAPPTGIADLLALSRRARIIVSGDTGPLHIAGAAGTPIVAIFGPTNPARNGPWAADDVVVSRYDQCGCHYRRRCDRREWCLADVTVAEVTAAVQQRLGAVAG